MKWKRIGIMVVGFGLLAAFVLRLSFNKRTSTERIYHYDKGQALNVHTQTIKLEKIDREFSYPGNFEGNRETKVSAETQGKINNISVEVGDYVSKGQHLVQLDRALLLRQLDVIKVQIENAKVEYNVQLKANQIQVDGLKRDVDRFAILAEFDAVQGVQLEKAEMQLATVKNQRVAILQKAGLKAAEAQRSSIEEQINKTTIRAPFDGIVTMKFSEIGAFAAPGSPILQITDLGVLKFTINVSEREIMEFQVGKIYAVFADVYPDQALAGKTILIGSKANAGGSYPIQFTLENSSGPMIRSGMFGKVSLRTESEKKGIFIPSSAVIGNEDQYQVYLVKEGKAIIQEIDIAQRIQGGAIVTKGIREGDVLVTKGLINLFDGANVTSN